MKLTHEWPSMMFACMAAISLALTSCGSPVFGASGFVMCSHISFPSISLSLIIRFPPYTSGMMSVLVVSMISNPGKKNPPLP